MSVKVCESLMGRARLASLVRVSDIRGVSDRLLPRVTALETKSLRVVDSAAARVRPKVRLTDSMKLGLSTMLLT